MAVLAYWHSHQNSGVYNELTKFSPKRLRPPRRWSSLALHVQHQAAPSAATMAPCEQTKNWRSLIELESLQIFIFTKLRGDQFLVPSNSTPLKQATVLWKGYKTDSPALPLEFFKNITFSITQSLDACGCQYWIHHGWCSSNKKGCVSCVITLHGWRTLKIPGTRERQMKWFGPDCLGLKHPWVCRWTPLYVVSFVALILQKRLLWAKSLKEISEGGEWTLLSDFLYLIKRRSSKVPPNPCHRRFKTNSSHLKKGPTTHNSWELVSMSLRLCDLHFSQHGVDGRKPWLSLRSPLMRWEINAALKCCTLGVLCCLISFHSTLPDPKIISSKSTSELHTKRVTNCIACSSESSNFRALRLLFHDIHTLPTHVHRAQKKISTKPRTRPTIWKQSSYLAAVAWQILKVEGRNKKQQISSQFLGLFWIKKNTKPKQQASFAVHLPESTTNKQNNIDSFSSSHWEQNCCWDVRELWWYHWCTRLRWRECWSLNQSHKWQWSNHQ